MSEHREPWKTQEKRIVETLVSAIQKFSENHGETDNPVKLKVAKLMAKSDVNESTFYHNAGHWRLDELEGVKYIENKGKITVKPQTFLEAQQ